MLFRSIDNNLRLKQVKIEDPFFEPIEIIIKDKHLINKFFMPIFSRPSHDEDELKLIEQYNSKSAFWVFTYCKTILPRAFERYIKAFNYKSADDINEIILQIETWILKGGILSSINDKLLVEKTLERVVEQVSSSKIIKKVLSLLNDKRLELLDDLKGVEQIKSLEEVYYLLSFINFESINGTSHIEKIITILDTVELNNSNRKILNLLVNKISLSKKKFFNDSLENMFELIEIGNLRFESSEYKGKFFNWSYCEYLIYRKLELFPRANLLLAIILRQFFYIIEDVNLKGDILLQSYDTLVNYRDKLVSNPFEFNKGLKISDNGLKKVNQNKIKNAEWIALEESFLKNSILTVNVGKKLRSGYEINFNGIFGFIPNSKIKDIRLKNSVLEEVDFTITVRCINFNKEFSFFVVEQLLITEEGYKSIDNSRFSKNNILIVKGAISGIDDMGLFVITELGQGLLHKHRISPHIWDAARLRKHFRIRDNIFFIIKKKENDRIDLSMLELERTDLQIEYYNFIERVDNDYLPDFEGIKNENNKAIEESILDSVLVERAYCFEQFALLQKDIAKKISTLKMASELFESVKNSRADYAKIYTSYFETLLTLQVVISDFNDHSLSLLNAQVDKTLEKITENALESFPDFEKLIFFLNILQLFNDKSEKVLDLLYNYIKKYSAEKHSQNLETIAKITLSNNLLVSLGEDTEGFSKKNLALIFSYIQNGVLSLKESVDDQLKRETEDQINYWRGKIGEDESQTMEFKASFKTPILDQKRLNELKILNVIDKPTLEIQKKISRINGDLAIKAIVHSALKTLCAFANTSGGILMLGVTDAKDVVGLQRDYDSLKQKDRDGFGKMFDEHIKSYFEESFSTLLDKKFLKFPEGDVFIVTVKESPDEVFMLKNEEGKDAEELYIRGTTTSELLEGIQLTKFIRRKHSIGNFKVKYSSDPQH